MSAFPTWVRWAFAAAGLGMVIATATLAGLIAGRDWPVWPIAAGAALYLPLFMAARVTRIPNSAPSAFMKWALGVIIVGAALGALIGAGAVLA